MMNFNEMIEAMEMGYAVDFTELLIAAGVDPSEAVEV